MHNRSFESTHPMFHHFMHAKRERCAAFMAARDEAAGETGARGFGRRGPFGRHRSGPFGGRGPRMFDSGALRLVVLGLIAEEPRHGYDIIKAMEARFQGAYSPSPGAIYPMLQMLEEADLVTSQTTGTKRLYAITEAGQAYLADNKAELDRINAQLDAASGDIRESAIGEALHALRQTLHDKLRHGRLTGEQSARLRTILEGVRAEIEAL